MSKKHHNPEDSMDVWIYAIYVVVVLLIATIVTGARADTTDWTPVIVSEARRAGVDPHLALAIATVESNMNPDAIGGMGEVGLFQLRPEYHAVSRGATRSNIRLAMKYLAQLKRQCARYGDAFFVCYNYGPARKLNHPRQFPYYRKVMTVLDRTKHESERFIATAD